MNQLLRPARLVAHASRLRSSNGLGDTFDPVAVAEQVATAARRRAPQLDDDSSFPADDIATLADTGLLAAPLPREYGGADLGLGRDGSVEFARVLMIIGGGSLPLGRLYEGHANALSLIARYGRPDQVAHFATLVHAGHLFAVWNTEAQDGVRLTGKNGRLELKGRKVFASGAGHVRHPLITARDDSGELLMVIPTVDETERANLTGWTPHGMRASASGAVDFAGLPVTARDIIGGPDDFHKQPAFSTGAWRFAAVQTGGIGAVFDAARRHLVAARRDGNPHQRMRMGTAALAIQSARHWVLEAAQIASDETTAPEARIAHVHLTRTAVERAGLDVLELAQRSVGLAGFSRRHPMERLMRDLATYLRQPDPDGALEDAAAFLLESDLPVLDTWAWP